MALGSSSAVSSVPFATRTLSYFVCHSSDYSIKHDSVSDRSVNTKMAQKMALTSSLNYLVHLIRENNNAFVDSHLLKAAF